MTAKRKTNKKRHMVNKKYHVLAYVEGCSPKLRRFTTTKALDEFLIKFVTELCHNPDNFIDYVIYDVRGDILSHSGILIEGVV